MNETPLTAEERDEAIDAIVLHFWDAISRLDTSSEERGPILRQWAETLANNLEGALSEGEVARTAGPVSSDATIHLHWITLKNGKRIPASDYLAAGNAKVPIRDADQRRPQTRTAKRPPKHGVKKEVKWTQLPNLPARQRGKHLRYEKMSGEEAAKIVNAFMDAIAPTEQRLASKVAKGMRAVKAALGEGDKAKADAAAKTLETSVHDYADFHMARNKKILEFLGTPQPSQVNVMVTGGIAKSERDAINKAVVLFNHLVGRQVASNAPVYFRSTQSGRSYFGDGAVHLSNDDCHVSAILHQMGHWLEQADSTLKRSAVVFLNKRTRGRQAKPLGSPYAPDERARPDNFLDPYIGKDYGSQATELVSMALELFYRDPGVFAASDPEMFAWAYDAIQPSSAR